MCARPRRISDEEVFAAALRAMSRLPPAELTLAAIGAEAGVTAGALVQRFGSKRELLLALARAGADGEADLAVDFLSKHRSPLEALDAYARCMAGLAESPAAFQRSLLYLQQDLADPELRHLLARQTEGNRSAIAAILAAAVDAGELRPDADPVRLAAIVEALIAGGMMSWAFRAKGEAAAWVLGLLHDALVPWRSEGKPSSGRRKR